LKIIIVYVT